MPRLATLALLLIAPFLPGCIPGLMPAGSDSGTVFSRLRGDGTNQLVGDVIWAGHKNIITPQSIHGRLTGPGGSGHERAVSCTLQSCMLGESRERGWSLEGLSEGTYTVELKNGADLLARVEVRLVKVPTVGGKTSLVADVSQHTGTFETVFTQKQVWLPVDKRQPDREVSWMWLKDAEFVSVQTAGVHSTTVADPEIVGTLEDFMPVEVRSPLLRRGVTLDGAWELFLFWSGSEEPAAHFDVTFPKAKTIDQTANRGRRGPTARAAEPAPWSVVSSSSPSAAHLKAAIAHLPKGGFHSKPHSEEWVCAVTLDPAAGQTAQQMLKVRQELRTLQAKGGIALDDMRETARARAADQGRELSVQEENAVSEMGMSAMKEAGVDARVQQLNAELHALAARIDALATKQKKGCMAKALSDEFKTAATARSAPR